MTPTDVKHVIDGRFNRLRVLDIVAVEEKREPAMLFQEKVGGMRRQAVLSGEIADCSASLRKRLRTRSILGWHISMSMPMVCLLSATTT